MENNDEVEIIKKKTGRKCLTDEQKILSKLRVVERQKAFHKEYYLKNKEKIDGDRKTNKLQEKTLKAISTLIENPAFKSKINSLVN